MSSKLNPALFSVFTFSSVLALLFFGFCMDWHYDEAWTYNGTKGSNPVDIIQYTYFNSANNHVLNSLYFYILESLGLKNVVFYRLLSIAGFIIFVVANLKFAKRNGLSIISIFILVFAPYFLYFVLGRGYGLALGFHALSFLYLHKFLDSKSSLHGSLFVLSGIVSTLSIFSFLYPFLAMWIVYSIINEKKIFSAWYVIQAALVMLLLFYVYRTGKIINADEVTLSVSGLFDGGTLSSIISDMSYFKVLQYLSVYSFIRYLVFACVLFSLAHIAVRFASLSSSQRNFTRIISVVFLLSVFLMFLAHMFAGAKYPAVRAVFYLQYMLLLLVSVSLSIAKNFWQKLPAFMLLLLGFIAIFLEGRDVLLPGNRMILKKIDNHPIYIKDKNPSIKHTNALYKLTTAEIIQEEDQDVFVERFTAEQRNKIYLLTYDTNTLKSGYVISEVTPVRSRWYLIEYTKEIN